MFSKPYRLKTNTGLKNSEKKLLIQRIRNEFPNVTEEQAKELVPNKSTANSLKIMNSSGDTVCIYSVDNMPIIIDAYDKLYPTVCALWKVPDMVPTITIHEPIVAKLKAGVPLYVPGIVIPPGGRGFPLFPLGTTIAVNSDSNMAAAAVGKALMSSANMMMSSSGVCLETLHVLGDFLCREQKFAKIERPEMGPPRIGEIDRTEMVTTNLQQMTINAPKPTDNWPTLGSSMPRPNRNEKKDDWPSLGERTKSENHTVWGRSEPQVRTADRIIDNTRTKDGTKTTDSSRTTDGTGAVDGSKNADGIGNIDGSRTIDGSGVFEGCEDAAMGNGDGFPDDMDGLLRFCLLSFMKMEGKKTQLPLKTNLLYRNHMVPLCPPDRSLDVKKSTYKKMSKFMEAMQQEGLLQVKMIEKGVDAVTGMDLSHPAVRGHRVPETVLSQVEEARKEPEDSDAYVAPVVREMFSITANIQDMFAPLRKGTLVTAADVRTAITDYVRRRGLQSEEARGMVRVDCVLAKITGKDGLVSWEDVNAAVQGKMTACTEMRFADGTVRTNKSRLEPIKMNVATRSGNKKVTLVSNLEEFGFSLPALGKVCQHALSVSSTVTRTAGSKHDQLMVQGDQTYYITKMLIEKYHIPKKFIEGADKMLKKKK